jgi:hypothetical protein
MGGTSLAWDGEAVMAAGVPAFTIAAILSNHLLHLFFATGGKRRRWEVSCKKAKSSPSSQLTKYRHLTQNASRQGLGVLASVRKDLKRCLMSEESLQCPALVCPAIYAHSLVFLSQSGPPGSTRARHSMVFGAPIVCNDSASFPPISIRPDFCGFLGRGVLFSKRTGDISERWTRRFFRHDFPQRAFAVGPGIS